MAVSSMLGIAAMCCTGVPVALAGAPAGVDAASDPPARSEGEITVTATRKSETLSKVPLSVAAYNQRDMDTKNVRRVEDIARLTPGITFGRSPTVNGNNTTIAIRGIASGVGAATTGVYIDDTPIQVRLIGNTASNPYPMIFDLDRVEVLRGPQGTLFGASSEGGAVRFITPKPGFEKYTAYARSEVSTIDGGGMNYEAGGAVGGPIIKDKLAFRASAWYRRDGGWIDRTGALTAAGADKTVVKKDINTQTSLATKFALGWKPVDNVTITPSIYYQDQHIRAPNQFLANISDPANGQYNTPLQAYQGARDRFILPALLVEVDLGAVSVVSNTSYFDRRVNSGSDLTYIDAETFGSKVPYTQLPGQVATGTYLNTQKTFNQEIRIQSKPGQRLSWMVGGFYSRQKQYQFQTITDGSIDQLLQASGGVVGVYKSPMLAGNVFFLTHINTLDEQVSGFAQADYAITSRLKVTAGVRVSQTRFVSNILRDGPLAGGLGLTSGHKSETPVTPKFALSYQFPNNTLFYASAAKGFRPGGAQAALSAVACATDLKTLGLTQSPTTFNSDSLWSYEIGAKKRIAGLVQIEASGYVIKWKNLQQIVALPTCGGSYIANTGNVTARGFDISTTVNPVEGLTLSAAMAFTKSSFDSIVYTVPPSVLKEAGSQLPISPMTITASGEYDFNLSGSRRGYLRADYQHADATPRSNPLDYNYDGATNVIPPTDNLDLRAGMRFRGIDASVFVTNTTNNKSTTLGRTSRTSALIYASTPRPRTIGLTASYRY